MNPIGKNIPDGDDLDVVPPSKPAGSAIDFPRKLEGGATSQTGGNGRYDTSGDQVGHLAGHLRDDHFRGPYLLQDLPVVFVGRFDDDRFDLQLFQVKGEESACGRSFLNDTMTMLLFLMPIVSRSSLSAASATIAFVEKS